MSRRIRPELRLAAACCRWPPSPKSAQAIGKAARGPVDWELFEAIASRNGIVPLINRARAKGALEVPPALAKRLSERAYAAAVRGVLMAGEAIRLQRAFDDVGLAVMIIKGAPLAVLAYDELGLKDSGDIDILVAPEDAVRAIGLMIELGYDGELAKLPAGRRDDYVHHAREAGFSRRQPWIVAELHWRLCHNRNLLRGMGVSSPSQEVVIPGGRLRTLADEELFSYLCVHGGTHNWSRLKWLADVSALLGRRSGREIGRFYAAASAYGASRPAAVALLLCRELFALPLDESLVRSLERDRIARLLVSNVLGGLDYRRGASEHQPYTLAWLRMLTAQFVLSRGGAHAMEQLRVLWNNPVDRAHVFLPRNLGFAYHLIRVPLWLGRMFRRLFKASRS